MGSICRVAAIACVLLAGQPAWAEGGAPGSASAGARERIERTVVNKSAHTAWITLLYPELGPDASASRCVGPDEAARFVAEPGARAVVSAESRSAPQCRGATSCKASAEWPGEQGAMSFASDGKSCTLLVPRRHLASRVNYKWGRLNVANESKTHALFVKVIPPPTAKASQDEFACVRPGYSATFLVPPGEEENWKRGRYHRFVEAELRPLGSNCTLKTVCRSALEVEWIVPGDRGVAMHAAAEGPRKTSCLLELVR